MYEAGAGFTVVNPKASIFDTLTNWKGYDYTKRGTSFDNETIKKAEKIAEEKKIVLEGKKSNLGVIAILVGAFVVLNIFRR